MDDGETFTNEWKIKISTHPVIFDVFQHLLKVNNYKVDRVEDPEDDYDVNAVYAEFIDNIAKASKKFYDLKTDAFNEAEKVQDGLHLVTSVLFQFNPKLKGFNDRQETYKEVNKMFWGYYFYWNGVDGARNVGKTDKLTPWQAAKIFAEDFWKSEKDGFLPTIALGVEYVEENLKRATEIALQQLHDAPTDGGVH